MMDAENYAKALKNADDTTIVEVAADDRRRGALQLRPHGSAKSRTSASRSSNSSSNSRRTSGEQQQDDRARHGPTRTRRMPAVNVDLVARLEQVRAGPPRLAQGQGPLGHQRAGAARARRSRRYRYAMPGEENIPQSEIYVFDRNSKQRVTVKADRFKDQTRADRRPCRSATTSSAIRGGPIPAQWLSDAPDKLYFTRLSRDLHRLDVCVADTATGEVKPLIEERLNTYIESKPLRLVNGGAELIFWSERDGWGHFYLYDAATGALKNRITEGRVRHDRRSRASTTRRASLYLTAAGREKGEDPYYTHLYRVGLDGTGHEAAQPRRRVARGRRVANRARFFVDNSSRVERRAGVDALRHARQRASLKLETPDLSALMEAGFKFPEPFTVKADDGVTDLYGVMYKPFDFDPAKKYPIIAYVYPGPQTESVTKTFNPRSNNISLAQFGFIVIEVGNRGGHPQRSKWYHNYGYGNLRDYGLADKKAAIEQLARRHPFIDINRVGIWGHSGGGFMSAAAMLVYPDFFKVAWSESGNHENNIYNNTLEREAPRHQGSREGRQGHLRVRHREELGAGQEPEGPPDARSPATSTTTSTRRTPTAWPTR